MFSFGLIEILIVLALLWVTFRQVIRRRWPDFHRAFNFIFFATAVLALIFGLLARVH